MKTFVAFLAVLAPAAALAHDGDHARIGFVGTLAHLLTEPDHLAMLAVAAAVVAVVVWRKGRVK